MVRVKRGLGRRTFGLPPALIATLLLAALLALLGWWVARPGPLATAATGANDFVVEMHDYRFAPSSMTWHVGDQVTLTFVNRSEAHPGKTHEFMMGHDPRRESSMMLGPKQEDGFEQDFFTGMRVWFGNAEGVEMLMPGEADVVGGEAARYYMRMQSGGMAGDSSMSMGATQSPSMSMGGDGSMSDGMSASATPSMQSGDGMSGSMSGGMVMKGNGLMIDLDAGGRATIRFTVPDRPGTWTFGCFDQSGQHFLNGMRGTVTIVG